MKCPSCSKPVSMTDRYCIFCGYDLKGLQTGATRTPSGRPGADRPARPRPRPDASRRIESEADWGPVVAPGGHTPKKKKKNAGNTRLVVLAAVAAVAFIVVAVLLLTKKGDEKPAEQSVIAVATEAPAATQAASVNTGVLSFGTASSGTAANDDSSTYLLKSEEVERESDGSYAADSFIDVYTVLKDAVDTGAAEVKVSAAGVTEAELNMLLGHFGGDFVEPTYTEADGVYSIKTDTPRMGLKVLNAARSGAAGKLQGEEARLYAKAKEIVDACTKGAENDEAKARALCDRITGQCSSAAEGTAGTAADALLAGSADSTGRADAYRLLCGLAGLEVRCISSTVTTTGEVRVWNIVKLNGLWYAVNTADDSFMVTLDHLRSDETWNEYTLPDGAYAM